MMNYLNLWLVIPVVSVIMVAYAYGELKLYEQGEDVYTWVKKLHKVLHHD